VLPVSTRALTGFSEIQNLTSFGEGDEKSMLLIEISLFFVFLPLLGLVS
jgi:hypothetical protein